MDDEIATAAQAYENAREQTVLMQNPYYRRLRARGPVSETTRFSCLRKPWMWVTKGHCYCCARDRTFKLEFFEYADGFRDSQRSRRADPAE